MHRHLVRSTFVFAAVLSVLALGGTPAAAKATAFSDAYDGTTTDASCGFAVQVHDVGKVLGRLFFDADGAFVGVDVTNSGVVTYTNLDDSLSVTGTYQVLFKNFNQVDNGDGTLSLDQTTVGATTLRGPNGEVLLRSHGPVTAHLVINPEATSEAEFLVSREVVFEHGSHPSDEAYCQALTAAIGPDATP